MLSTGCFINQNSLMEYFVFYGELILTFVKAAFCANQNIHGVLLHTANRFVCRSGYGVKIFLAVVNNNVEVKVAIGMGCAVCKRAEQINTSGIDLFNESLLYDFNFIHWHCKNPLLIVIAMGSVQHYNAVCFGENYSENRPVSSLICWMNSSGVQTAICALA